MVRVHPIPQNGSRQMFPPCLNRPKTNLGQMVPLTVGLDTEWMAIGVHPTPQMGK